MQILEIEAAEQGNQDTLAMIYNKIKDTKITINKDDGFKSGFDNAIKKLSKTLEKISNTKGISKNEAMKKISQKQHAAMGLAPNEEVKGLDLNNIDSSIELGSCKSVSDSDDEDQNLIRTLFGKKDN
jgi:hypothetical protein